MSKAIKGLKVKIRFQIRRMDKYLASVDEEIAGGDLHKLKLIYEGVLEIKMKTNILFDELFEQEEVDEEKEFEGCETIQDKMEKLELKLRRALEGIQSTADTKQAKGLETVKLPKFELPHFYGDANSWFNFKEVFGMVIDQNPGLDDLQKLQYLGSAVKGEAARLICGFPVLSESYKQAWDTLVSRYDNQRELAYAQLNKIFKIKQMKNPSTKALRELLDTCNESVRNLGSLGLQRNELVMQEILVTKDLARSAKKGTIHCSMVLTEATKAQKDAKPQICTPVGEVNNTSVEQGNETINQVLLATAQIIVEGESGAQLICRALRGIGNNPVQGSSISVSLKLKSIYRSEIYETNALVMEVLTAEIPNFKMAEPTWIMQRDFELADPLFHISAPIDVILGADMYAYLMHGEKKLLGRNQPIAMNSRLGWILMGKVDSSLSSNYIGGPCSFTVQKTSELDGLVRDFWELESVPSLQDQNPRKENYETYYMKTYSRECQGRYSVKLLFKEKPSLLGQSREKALARFLALERRLLKTPREIIRDPSTCYYMPHHGVEREQSTTTKLRVVFDASAKTDSGTSLNQILETGPKNQRDIFVILTGFRAHPIAIIADIEKMFRQVRIHPEDADYQRILWRQTPEQPVEDYRLLTVTYGTTSAPFLAIRTIQQLARDECEEFPTASRVVMSDFYVDDLLTGVSSKQEGEELIKQMVGLMSKGSFEIKKWKSNCHELVSQMDETETELGVGASSRVLGIFWDNSRDAFRININNPGEVKKITTRDYLSNIARIFDPLGFLSPLTVALKIMMQELWKEKLSWDEPMSERWRARWNSFCDEMSVLTELEIPRYILMDQNSRNIQLHGFCDASSMAYSAVCYLKSKTIEGQVGISLIAAKTRVAPCKPCTLPRLESYSTLLDKIGSYYRWKKFISHRVMKIQQLTELKYWGHVSGKDNPADCASRGLKPAALIKHELWWQGPSWLKDDYVERIWENSNSDLQIQKQEEVVAFCHLQTTSVPEYFLKYSSFTRLKRVTAWCLRFGANCQPAGKERVYGPLTTAEMNRAIMMIVKLVQCSEFLHEIQSLNDHIQLPNKNRILDLGPFLDNEGLLRVGGRLQRSNLSSNQKHPMILPKKHHITRLIIQEYHQRYLHAGPHLVLSLIRNKYWILGGREIVRRVVKNCLICFKLRARTVEQIMGNLPPDRVNPSRPFLKTGIDIAGPFGLRPSLIRTSLMNPEEFTTLLCQIEAFLNSRPLVESSSDPNDLQALTPGHFLIAKLKKSDARSTDPPGTGAELVTTEPIPNGEFPRVSPSSPTPVRPLDTNQAFWEGWEEIRSCFSDCLTVVYGQIGAVLKKEPGCGEYGTTFDCIDGMMKKLQNTVYGILSDKLKACNLKTEELREAFEKKLKAATAAIPAPAIISAPAAKPAAISAPNPPSVTKTTPPVNDSAKPTKPSRPSYAQTLRNSANHVKLTSDDLSVKELRAKIAQTPGLKNLDVAAVTGGDKKLVLHFTNPSEKKRFVDNVKTANIGGLKVQTNPTFKPRLAIFGIPGEKTEEQLVADIRCHPAVEKLLKSADDIRMVKLIRKEGSSSTAIIEVNKVIETALLGRGRLTLDYLSLRLARAKRVFPCGVCGNLEHRTHKNGKKCTKAAKCGYCTGAHLTEACDNKAALKCHRCGGKHSANSMACKHMRDAQEQFISSMVR
ncbi:hypothetical protein LAZ67_15003299 [Cordylochernes scorpioides]|uniref:Integrase zinc-binding domain-containing protein n=1 Tax=Cordylochernes scorpioides TaxID=51811 RepID=A0ABY6LDR0_9ARAC|nr:hypothetical protein LAZ67_15003299 [Cordylochernes scorpioides]